MEQTTVQIGKATGISRFTLQQAVKHNLFPARQCECGRTHIIDTSTPEYQAWLKAHASQPRVIGKNRKDMPEEEKEWSVLDQLLSDEGYHDFRIVKNSGKFEPQHDDGTWRTYEKIAYETAQEAMDYLMQQSVEM